MQREERTVTFRISIATLAAAALLGCGFGAGFLVAARGGSAAALSSGEPSGVDFSPVWKAWEVLNEKFVPAAVSTSTPIATTTAALNQQKVWGMIEGLASSLNDPYTFFLPPQENQQFSSDMQGSFEGVGMEIDVKNQVLTVISPLKGTPAARAGIRAGDQILAINGVSTDGMDTSTAVGKIRGPRGTTVVLTIERAGWASPKDISVVRDVIDVPVVTEVARSDGIFDIQLSEFTANSPDLFRGALRQFIRSGDSKLILDLRGNPGGYLDAAVDIGSYFLPQGDVIVTEDYAGHADNIVHRSFGYDVFNKNLRMVILVDKGSASAAEILSDALRYWSVAKLVGEDTYGKGSVQELVEITSDTSLKVTVARWLGPDGAQIPRDGITPDYSVALSDADTAAGRDPQLDKAVGLLGGNTKLDTPTAQ